MLLGIVMSNLTKKELPSLYREALFEPLSMNSTFFTYPTNHAWNKSILFGMLYTAYSFEIAFFVCIMHLTTSAVDVTILEDVHRRA